MPVVPSHLFAVLSFGIVSASFASDGTTVNSMTAKMSVLSRQLLLLSLGVLRRHGAVCEDWLMHLGCSAGIYRPKIRDDAKIAWLVRARDLGTVCPEVVASIPAKTPKTENSTLHGFELHTLSSKGTE